MMTFTTSTTDEAQLLTLEEAWQRANEFYHSIIFGDAESLIFDKLMRETRVFLLEPSQMARLIIKNMRLAQQAKKYFGRDYLTDIEVSYYVLLVARGEIT